PDETGRALGKRIDRVELGHEIGEQRIVERRPGAGDIQLGEMALAHHGSGRPSKLKNLPLSAGVSVEIFSRMLVTLSRGVISAPGPPMSVRTQPGWNSTTVMPREARSTASVFATMLSAALLDRQMRDPPLVLSATLPILLVMLTMSLRPPRSRWSTNASAMCAGAMLLT